MRIAYVCADGGVPVFGSKGCSVHVIEVVRAMKRHGARVDLFAARLGGHPPAGFEGVSLHALPPSAGGDPATRERAALRANEALRRALARVGPFDAVYERHSLWSHAGMQFARETGIPGVLEVNAPLIEEQAEHRVLGDRAAATRVAERAFAAAGTIVAVSTVVADYVRRFPGTDGRVHVLPNGVDPFRFGARGAAPRQAVGDVFRVGFVGTLKAWHGVPVLIEAIAMLHAEDPRVRLQIVGDGPERARVTQDVAARGLLDVVSFTGAVPPEDIPALLGAMDAAAAPYAARAGFYFSPLKVLEYMAAGVPVVASRLGQIEEIVADGETGLLCVPDDAEALADRLRLLRDRPDLRLRLAAAARAVVERRHSWDEVMRQIFTLAGITLPFISSPPPTARAVASVRS